MLDDLLNTEPDLPAVRNADPDSGAASSNRQGHPHRGPAGPRDGGQIRRPPAAVSTGKDLRPCRPGHPLATLAPWVGQTGVQLQRLVDVLREVVLAQRELVPEGLATAKALITASSAG